MKQYLFLATAIATASLFTGCSNNEYVGDQPEAFNGTDGAIAFSMGKANTTRTEPIGGKDAAGKLNDVFYVYGTKTVSGAQKTVFDTYKVKYTNGSTSASNTKGWEYVLSAPNLWQDSEKTNVGGGVDNQTIKYWDYSASEYTFYAFSAKPDDVKEQDAPNIKVERLTAPDEEGYTVTIKDGAHIEDLYFADKVEISKSTNSTATVSNQYGGFVTLAFRNVGSKIRMGFYETIPGYDVNITKLKIDCPNSTPKSDGASKVTVKYNTAGDTPNQPVITIENFDPRTSLDLGGNATTVTKIGNDYTNLTWTKTVDNYTPVWPQSALTSGICKVTVDYTLTSTDGSGETINVTGATAEVPTECIRWKSNYAYTYVFKISDQTNGNTGETSDPAGLYPIIFDAVVTEMAEDYLTTVSDLSITATQGKQFAEADKAVFKTGEAINVKVMYNSNDITSNVGSQTGSNKFEVAFVENTDYDYNKSPEHNLPNGTSLVPINQNSPVITLDGQDNPGFWIVKVTYKDGEKIITKYAVLKVETVPTPPSQEGGQG